MLGIKQQFDGAMAQLTAPGAPFELAEVASQATITPKRQPIWLRPCRSRVSTATGILLYEVSGAASMI